ncbi:MAG TPA: hypothetical protein PKO06_02740 [Candidatus Ozemobacteraceae bacterium]|nr:hypothetical protein [Candidatus Ozemobacteraceae bacterium]
MIREQRRGVSLVELLFGVVISGLVVWLLFLVLHTETRLTRRTQQRTEAAREARQILDWLRDDLVHCCQPLSGGRFRPSLVDALERRSDGGLDTFSFLCFSRELPLADAVPLRRFGKSHRQASRITWRLVQPSQPSADGCLALERIVQMPTTGTSDLKRAGYLKRLSERVLAFSIRPQTITAQGERVQIFRVSVRLRHADTGGTSGGVCEMFEVVCPDFFQSTWSQHGIRHPWHAIMSGP